MAKFGELKPAAAIMAKLEEMFPGKHINKSLIHFSGLDATNAMSGKQNGKQRKMQHVSQYTLYINCCSQRLCLCFVHIIKECRDLQAVDTLILSIWKIFEYSSVKQTIFENAQTTEGLKPEKILKACTTRWRNFGMYYFSFQESRGGAGYHFP